MGGLMGMSSVVGGSQLSRAFSQLRKNATKESGDRVFGLGEDILTEAVRLAPIEFGGLRGSASVQREDASTILLAFAKDYALFVHEIPPESPAGDDPPQWRPGTRTAEHKPPTQWKFLEKPALAAWEGIGQAFSGSGDLLRTVNWPKGI